MNRLQPTPAILTLLPALALIPLLAVVLGSLHGGGMSLIGSFVEAAFHPSLEIQVLQSAIQRFKCRAYWQQYCFQPFEGPEPLMIAVASIMRNRSQKQPQS